MKQKPFSFGSNRNIPTVSVPKDRTHGNKEATLFVTPADNPFKKQGSPFSSSGTFFSPSKKTCPNDGSCIFEDVRKKIATHHMSAAYDIFFANLKEGLALDSVHDDNLVSFQEYLTAENRHNGVPYPWEFARFMAALTHLTMPFAVFLDKPVLVTVVFKDEEVMLSDPSDPELETPKFAATVVKTLTLKTLTEDFNVSVSSEELNLLTWSDIITALAVEVKAIEPNN
jgi:hypothetical protein